MSNLNISIIGYGKMGKLINEIATQRGIDVVSIVDPEYVQGYKEISEKSVGPADVCIDFTTPHVVVDNIKKLIILGKNIVVGTTQWDNHLDEIRNLVEQSDIGLVYTPNFSYGGNAYFQLVSNASEILGDNGKYDASGHEIHHKRKLDAPSGTARELERIITENFGKETHFSSQRLGYFPGTHITTFDSEDDTIQIIHTAKNRKGFAHGALLAAEFIKDKKGFYDPEYFRKYLLGERK